MKIFNSLGELTSEYRQVALTLGNFDGVHLGHRALLQALKHKAKALSVPTLLITFEPHPLKVLHPEHDFKRLLPYRDMLMQLEASGLDLVVIEAFTKDFSGMSAEQFLNDYLFAELTPQSLLLGHDFRFGKDREGDISLINKLYPHYQVEQFPAFKINGERVSSSRLRELLACGQMEAVTQFLGRPLSIYGKVIPGDQRGRTLGFPTANIHFENESLPPNGVYASEIEFGGQSHNGITNIGRRPTFKSESRLSVETHLFNFKSEIYNQSVRLNLHKRIRDEKKFDGPEALVKQIHADIFQAKAYLGVSQ